jgi:hypothetical protein
VVTPEGLLGWQGVLFCVFDVDKGARRQGDHRVEQRDRRPRERQPMRALRRRAQGLSAPPLSIRMLIVGATTVDLLVAVAVDSTLRRRGRAVF